MKIATIHCENSGVVPFEAGQVWKVISDPQHLRRFFPTFYESLEIIEEEGNRKKIKAKIKCRNGVQAELVKEARYYPKNKIIYESHMENRSRGGVLHLSKTGPHLETLTLDPEGERTAISQEVSYEIHAGGLFYLGSAADALMLVYLLRGYEQLPGLMLFLLALAIMLITRTLIYLPRNLREGHRDMLEQGFENYINQMKLLLTKVD